jgi:predicted DNA-binding transcriptional regulator AlpA
MQENRLLSPKEIMHRYGISRTTLRNWIKTKNFPIIKISEKKKYAIESDLREWEEEQKTL